MVEQAKVGEGSAEAKPDATEGRSRRSSNGARRSKTPKVAPGASGRKRKSPATLEKLFEDGLKDIYYAEKKILTALPRMEKSAGDRDLQNAFARHRRQTEFHVERLDRVFKLLGEHPKGKPCPAINGIIEEGQELTARYEAGPVLDAALLAAAQAVEHYEIARYGALREWARELNLREAVRLFQDTLREEEDVDRMLSDLAEEVLNTEAARG
jgi:ferritin-like metal-binding protein YciE